LSKRDPLDFVLWKHAKSGEPSWPSPWGAGRPGWHIECSAMACALLGNHFDIHGGGQDLQFPHHENEIAQSEGAHGGTFVNVWMHNGFVRVDEEKMSKSLGNFFTVREILKKYDPEVVRFFILRAHYRSPLNYSDQHLDDAKDGLTRLYNSIKNHELAGNNIFSVPIDWSDPNATRFKYAMDDDFNTPEAIAVLFDLANETNKTGDLEIVCLLRALAGVLGLLQRSPLSFLQNDPIVRFRKFTDEMIRQAIKEREAARKTRDFQEADHIRRQLLDEGIILEDTPQGTTWRRS
jgi:cysteinyl-tRNA synthetase